MPKKKTHEEYVAEVARVNPNIEVLGTYINNCTKILHKCKIDEYEWEVTPNHLLRGRDCPKCSKTYRRTHEEYIMELAKINPNIEVLGTYVNVSTKILHRCKNCNYKWEVKPSSLLYGTGCPKCNGNNKKTHEEYIMELAKINPNIEVLGTYINTKTKILHRCKIDGYEWINSPHQLLQGTNCPKCSRSHKKTQEEYIAELVQVNPNIQVVEEYINNSTKITHKCKICGYKWMISPNHILQKIGCPICNGKQIGPPPEYKNSIWASELKEHFSKYFTEKQMKEYMPYSSKKLLVECPDCHRQKSINIYNLANTGLACVCGDGQSYPNKFIYGLLNQLNIEYKTEYSPEWADKKRYDIYIPKFNCIIENHGAQHYNGSFQRIKGKSLEEEQYNDKIKKQKAINNGISYYVELDCRISNINWIKNSIINSSLLNILGYKKEDINWILCEEFAISNVVKKVADLWNRGLSVKTIQDNLHISKSTAINYLKRSTKLNWCNYNKKESNKRGQAQRRKNNKTS